MPDNKPKKRGPNTEEGKRNSSLNALKHGLYAKTPRALDRTLTDAQREEDELRESMLTPQVSFAEAQERLRECHKPQDPTEDMLVDRMALCMFRLSMFEGMGWLSLSRNPFRGVPSQSLVAAMKAERMALMEFHRCLRALNAKRTADLRLAALKAQAHTESESTTPATRHLEPETQNSPDICVHLRSSAVDIQKPTAGDQKSVETNYSHEETEHEIVPSEPTDPIVERFREAQCPEPVTSAPEPDTHHPVPDSRPLTPDSRPVLRHVRRHLRPGRHNNCSRTTGLPGST